MALVASLFIGGTASAADARNFNPGRIIDDAVFTNSDSMTVQQIQNFLNSKVACDTYGKKRSELGGGTRAQWLASKGISTPITCLRDYYENPSNGANNYGKAIPAGAISAAEIIYNYSRQFNINPQVIIVTLQKENGLITDEWPTPKQYSESMGFGCPDNVAPGAPACDPAYGSFSTQVYQAARHFRGYINNTPGWWIPFSTGNNSIRWSPAASCGSSTVNIQNRSTVALYSYTPYRPNQAALNAQYGMGDSCSAYGNRNFYLYFSDWFGTTVGIQDLLSDGQGIYYISNGYKYYVPSMQEFYNLGYVDADIPRIIKTSTNELNKIPNKTDLPYVSTIAASANQGIFVISNGYKYYVPSMSLLYGYGFKDSDIMVVTEESINRYKNTNRNLSNFASDINGYAYRIENGKRRVIYQPWVLNEYQDASTSNQFSWSVLDRVPIGPPITKGRLGFVAGNNVYASINGKWYTTSADTISCLGLEGVIPIEPYRTVSDTTAGGVSSCFVRDESNNKYLLDGNIKYVIEGNDDIGYSSITVASGIADLQTNTFSQHKNIFATDSGIFKLQNNTARHIMSMGYVREVLGSQSPVLLKTDSLKAMSRGANVYETGSVISGPTVGINIVADDKVYYVSSMDQFYAYGLSVARIANVGDDEINRQVRGANIPGVKVTCSGQNYIVSGGVKYLVPSSITTAFGGSGNFSNIDCPVLESLKGATMTRFVTSPGDKNIYYIDAGTRRHILSWSTFLALGGTSSDVIILSAYALGSFPAGSPM